MVTLLPQVGDQVIDDINRNGIIDPGEPGLAGVVVRLHACDASLVAEDTSDANGFYGFNGLADGDYYVDFIAPSGYVFSPKDQGNDDAVDSDADPGSGQSDCFAFDTSMFNADVDACLYQNGPVLPVFLGNQVWHDMNGNGRQDGEPGISGVLVRLRSCAGVVADSMFTNSLGQYTFPFISPGAYFVEVVRPNGFGFTVMDAAGDDMMDSDVDPATGATPCFILRSGNQNFNVDAGLVAQAEPDPLCVVGDFVWNDLNEDGIQNAGEVGLPGVSVELFDCSGGLLASVFSDSLGAYQFSDLDAGDYSLVFGAPGGFLPSPKDVGSDDDVDSDASELDGSVACFTLNAGDTVTNFDAGFFLEPPPIQYGSIGDFVWEDANRDGLQDLAELGMPEIVVNLYSCDDVLQASVETDASGAYLFDSLLAGDFYVEFVAPEGYDFSPQNKSDNGEVDSDADVTNGRSACISLGDGVHDHSIDAGLFVKEEESAGCTRPRIWWKYHTGRWFWEDRVSEHLPVWLGQEGGSKSVKVESAQQAYKILSGKMFGRHYSLHSALYAELLAAKLNIASGADESEVSEAVANADEYLLDDDWRIWRHHSKGRRNNPVFGWVGALFFYNWGIIGPGNCDFTGNRNDKDRNESGVLSSEFDRDDFDGYIDELIKESEVSESDF